MSTQIIENMLKKEKARNDLNGLATLNYMIKREIDFIRDMQEEMLEEIEENLFDRLPRYLEVILESCELLEKLFTQK